MHVRNSFRVRLFQICNDSAASVKKRFGNNFLPLIIYIIIFGEKGKEKRTNR